MQVDFDLSSVASCKHLSGVIRLCWCAKWGIRSRKPLHVRLHSASEQPLRKFVLSEVGIADLIESALSAHSHIGDQGIRVVIETGLAEDVLMLSPGSTTSPYSSTVSPGRGGDGYCLSLVLRSTPAKLDKEITTRIEERLFASWLSEERAKAQVTWHWM